MSLINFKRQDYKYFYFNSTMFTNRLQNFICIDNKKIMLI